MKKQSVEANNPFHQPKAVWAVALACVVSFMGIGLVDPILPSLTAKLHATQSSVELLFTSYLVVTAVAMLGTGWVSSRIGGKRTLVAGLSLVVVFSFAAGASPGISEIIYFRAGWGLGNALFIATSLAIIIGAASGGFSGAIILYETALGVGIALGPLVGGELGAISWRGPFFGVTTLMAISLVATIVFVDKTPNPPRKSSLLEPFRALRHRGLATMCAAAMFYNWGFFTLLAYSPFVMNLGIHQLGYVFTAWGVLVAIFAIFVAQRLQYRFGTSNTLYVNLALLAVILFVIGAFTSSRVTVMVMVVASGMVVGINNTLVTQAVMLVSPVDRTVASSTYGFVRFIGGGLAPFAAAKLAAHYNVHVPFYVGSCAVLVGIVVLASGHRVLTLAERATMDEVASSTVTPTNDGRTRPVVVAVKSEGQRHAIIEAAIIESRDTSSPVELVHVIETDVIEELVIDMESTFDAQQLIDAGVRQLSDAGLVGVGHLLQVVSDHGDVGRRIADFANGREAVLIMIGSSNEPAVSGVFNADLTRQLEHDAHCPVRIVSLWVPQISD